MTRHRILLAATCVAALAATPAAAYASPAHTPAAVQAAYADCTVQIFTFGTGFQVFAAILNTTAAPLNGWTVRFTLPSTVATFPAFNGVLTRDATGGSITPMVWNTVIPPGGQLSVGFGGGGGPALVAPTGFALGTRPCTPV